MNTIVQDVRYGLRILVKNPGFTAIAVLTLALGIGITSAVFSVVNTVLFRPLPYKDPDQLVLIQETHPTGNNKEPKATSVSYPNLTDWQAQSRSLAGLAGKMVANSTITDGNRPEEIAGVAVSSQLFSLLGSEPALGRWFLPEEDRPDAQKVVILSHGLWQRRYGSDPNIIGTTIQLDKAPYTVVGVTAREFLPPTAIFYRQMPEIYLPLSATLKPDEAIARDRKFSIIPVIGRLKNGVTLAQADAELQTITANLAKQYPEIDEQIGVKLTPLKEHTVGKARTALLTFFGAVAIVLLIVCANIANLLLAKTAERQKEIAIRVALGASRWRIVRQLLTESLLLSLLGGGLGLLLSVWTLDLLVSFNPQYLPRLNEISVDKMMLGFTLLLCLVTTLGFGLLPALQAIKPALNDALKCEGRSVSADISHHRLRSLLIVSEVALTLALLVGAGLVMRSVMRMILTDPGFNPDNVLTMQLPLAPKYTGAAEQSAYLQKIIERVETVPGVANVSVADALPLTINSFGALLDAEGHNVTHYNEKQFAIVNKVGPNYFRTMGIPIVAGQDFSAKDWRDGAAVTVINKRLAERFWPEQNPIGKQIRIANPDPAKSGAWMTVVGVIADTKQFDLRADTKAGIYVLPSNDALPISRYHLTVRTHDAPARLSAPIQAEIRNIDKEQPVAEIQTMNQLFYQSIYNPHFYNLIFVVFAIAAMLIAAAGIYGVVSYYVAQRTQEIGIRIALGAQPADVLRLVVGESMRLVIIGIACGLALAVAFINYFTNSWFEDVFKQAASDRLTFILVPCLFALIGLLASYLPARRATRVDPMIALRTY